MKLVCWMAWKMLSTGHGYRAYLWPGVDMRLGINPVTVYYHPSDWSAGSEDPVGLNTCIDYGRLAA